MKINPYLFLVVFNALLVQGCTKAQISTGLEDQKCSGIYSDQTKTKAEVLFFRIAGPRVTGTQSNEVKFFGNSMSDKELKDLQDSKYKLDGTPRVHGGKSSSVLGELTLGTWISCLPSSNGSTCEKNNVANRESQLIFGYYGSNKVSEVLTVTGKPIEVPTQAPISKIAVQGGLIKINETKVLADEFQLMAPCAFAAQEALIKRGYYLKEKGQSYSIFTTGKRNPLKDPFSDTIDDETYSKAIEILRKRYKELDRCTNTKGIADPSPSVPSTGSTSTDTATLLAALDSPTASATKESGILVGGFEEQVIRSQYETALKVCNAENLENVLILKSDQPGGAAAQLASAAHACFAEVQIGELGIAGEANIASEITLSDIAKLSSQKTIGAVTYDNYSAQKIKANLEDDLTTEIKGLSNNLTGDSKNKLSVLLSLVDKIEKQGGLTKNQKTALPGDQSPANNKALVTTAINEIGISKLSESEKNKLELLLLCFDTNEQCKTIESESEKFSSGINSESKFQALLNKKLAFGSKTKKDEMMDLFDFANRLSKKGTTSIKPEFCEGIKKFCLLGGPDGAGVLESPVDPAKSKFLDFCKLKDNAQVCPGTSTIAESITEAPTPLTQNTVNNVSGFNGFYEPPEANGTNGLYFLFPSISGSQNSFVMVYPSELNVNTTNGGTASCFRVLAKSQMLSFDTDRQIYPKSILDYYATSSGPFTPKQPQFDQLKQNIQSHFRNTWKAGAEKQLAQEQSGKSGIVGLWNKAIDANACAIVQVLKVGTVDFDCKSVFSEFYIKETDQDIKDRTKAICSKVVNSCNDLGDCNPIGQSTK